MLDTRPHLISTDFPALRRTALSVLQVNLGYRCNLSCTHCHVNAGPTRTEQLSDETLAAVRAFLDAHPVHSLDLTGGAPEMHPRFRELVCDARDRGLTVIDRCNLTILLEPGQEDLAEFLASQNVRVVASLPCYQADNVSRQRGKGVFEDSITALRRLNDLGYGHDPARELDLVYNPVGAHLPPPQAELEADYKRELGERYGVVFNRLLTLANMPISRFGSVLLAQGQFDAYMTLLKDNHAEANLSTVMCRDQLSVDWRGRVYDCDFNQMLDLPLRDPEAGPAPARVHLSDLVGRDMTDWPIRVGEHCYGCTAGQGSSCGGALDG